jgi:hypothetical protein
MAARGPAGALCCTTCALAVLLAAIHACAQQSPPGNANDAPGWPFTDPERGSGRVVPDPTLGIESPETAGTGESCSLSSVTVTQQTTVNEATLQIPRKAKREYSNACHDLNGLFAAEGDHLIDERHRGFSAGPIPQRLRFTLPQMGQQAGSPQHAPGPLD